MPKRGMKTKVISLIIDLITFLNSFVISWLQFMLFSFQAIFRLIKVLNHCVLLCLLGINWNSNTQLYTPTKEGKTWPWNVKSMNEPQPEGPHAALGNWATWGKVSWNNVAKIWLSTIPPHLQSSERFSHGYLQFCAHHTHFRSVRSVLSFILLWY